MHRSIQSLSLCCVVLLLPFAVAASQVDPKVADKFEAWRGQFGKSYSNSDDDYQKALNAFESNDNLIASHNALETSWKLGHNHFSDLLPVVFRQRLMRNKSSVPLAPVATELLEATAEPPAAVDWVAKGAVTPVKDQANCGSCWAFGTTGAIEGAYQITTGHLVSLSEQNLVSCSFNGDAGCGGGEQSDGLCWVYHNGGICTEADYPYVSGGGKDGYACNTTCKKAVTVSGYKAVPKGNENALMQAILLGPVTIGIDAAADAFMLYRSGVLDGKCGNELDHAVLIVGYGTATANTEANKPYWKIKNSWNTDWGEKGYLRVVRGKNECGVADGALYPVGAAAAPASPAPAPPTKQCPAIPAPTPRFPLAYSVNATQTWGEASFPASGIVAVSYTKQKLLNTGYYLLAPEQKLYRCDLDPKAEFPGKMYYIGDNKKCIDGSKADPPMNCPWSRWSDELMYGLVSASLKDSKKPCPISPYGGGVSKGTACDTYIAGAGTDFVTTFWLTSKGNVPVKEYQQMKGKQGFTVTTYFSDYKVGEPADEVFNIPKGCPKAAADDAHMTDTVSIVV